MPTHRTCSAFRASTNRLSQKSKHQTHELKMTLSVPKGRKGRGKPHMPFPTIESHILKWKSCIRAHLVFDLLRARSARSTPWWILNSMYLKRDFISNKNRFSLNPCHRFQSFRPTGVRFAERTVPRKLLHLVRWFLQFFLTVFVSIFTWSCLFSRAALLRSRSLARELFQNLLSKCK